MKAKFSVWFQLYGIPFILLAGGILFVVLGARGIVSRSSWNEISVKVEKIEVRESVDEDGHTKYDYTYHAVYEVDGKEYHNIIQGMDSSQNPKEGDSITVRINPEDPNDLDASSILAIVIQILFGAGMLVVGVIMTKQTVRKLKEDKAQ